MLELLSPAGSMESVEAAVQNGADAVYLGLASCNARQGARNFSPDELREAVKYCHIRGVKVHLTLNTLLTDRELPQAADALQLTAEKLLSLGIADEIIPEPFGGAQRDYEKAAELLSGVLARHLSELRKLSGTRLREQRYAKFRAFGQFTDAAPEAEQPEEETVNDEAK